MLVVTRTRNTAVAIGDDVLVAVQEFGADHVVLLTKLPAGIALRGPEGIIETQQVADGATPSGIVEGLARLKVEDDLQIGDDVTIKIVEFKTHNGFPNRVRLGITAPPARRITRPE